MKKSYLFLALAVSAGLSLKLSDQLSQSSTANRVVEAGSGSTHSAAPEGDKPDQNKDEVTVQSNKKLDNETRIQPPTLTTTRTGFAESQSIDRPPEQQSALDAASAQKALAHPDASTRFNALLQYQGDDKAIAFEKLTDIIQFDPSPKVRMAALRISRNHPQSDSEKLRSLLNIALSDGNDDIRTEARNFLDQIDDSAALVQKSDQPDPQSQQIETSPL